MKLISLYVLVLLLACSQVAIAGGAYRFGPGSPPPQAQPYKNKTKILPTGKPNEPINNNINNKIGPKQKAFISHVDSSCKRRSNNAKKIIHLREIGKTELEQLATAKDDDAKSLIREVYELRGTSAQIETAIALKCMRQKKLNSVVIDTPTSNSATNTSAIVKKPSACGTIKASLDDIDRRRIAGQGGSEKFLNDLQEQQYTLMREMKAAGCFNNQTN
jgi:predicted DNA-binding ribbon-helix-helix protein